LITRAGAARSANAIDEDKANNPGIRVIDANAALIAGVIVPAP
jgi:hypothetical protein